MLAQNPCKEFEIYVGGWSETSGPDSYVVTSRSDTAGVKPWTLAQASEVCGAPMDAESQGEWLAMLPQNPLASAIRPEVEGLALMEIQRKRTFESKSAAPPGSYVGGYCQLTTIRRDAITTRILRRWPLDCERGDVDGAARA